MTEQSYTITKARYAKGMVAVSCPGIECSISVIKSRAGNLASHLAGNRYSNREKAYIMTSDEIRGTWEDFYGSEAFEIFDLAMIDNAIIAEVLGEEVEREYASWIYLNIK